MCSSWLCTHRLCSPRKWMNRCDIRILDGNCHSFASWCDCFVGRSCYRTGKDIEAVQRIDHCYPSLDHADKSNHQHNRTRRCNHRNLHLRNTSEDIGDRTACKLCFRRTVRDIDQQYAISGPDSWSAIGIEWRMHWSPCKWSRNHHRDRHCKERRRSIATARRGEIRSEEVWLTDKHRRDRLDRTSRSHSVPWCQCTRRMDCSRCLI